MPRPARNESAGRPNEKSISPETAAPGPGSARRAGPARVAVLASATARAPPAAHPAGIKVCQGNLRRQSPQMLADHTASAAASTATGVEWAACEIARGHLRIGEKQEVLQGDGLKALRSGSPCQLPHCQSGPLRRAPGQCQKLSVPPHHGRHGRGVAGQRTLPLVGRLEKPFRLANMPGSNSSIPMLPTTPALRARSPSPTPCRCRGRPDKHPALHSGGWLRQA